MGKLNQKKIEYLIREKENGKGTKEIASMLEITDRRVRQIWQEYKKTRKIPELKKRGRKRMMSEEEEKILIQLYEKYQVSARILEVILKREYNIHVSHNTIHRILKKYGLSRDEKNKKKRRKWIRFEREYSMSLWQMDWKKLRDGRWLIVILDDSSRCIMGYGIYPSPTSEYTVEVLRKAIDKFGVPDAILTDRGSHFYAKKGKTIFQQFLESYSIKHIVAQVHHPQTCGKVERFFWNVERKLYSAFEGDVDRLIHWYNCIRPHMSLEEDERLVRPVEAFFERLPPERVLGFYSYIFEVKK